MENPVYDQDQFRPGHIYQFGKCVFAVERLSHNACNAASLITNGQVTPFEFAFWDEVWFHGSQDFSLVLYLVAPIEVKAAGLALVRDALLPDHPL